MDLATWRALSGGTGEGNSREVRDYQPVLAESAAGSHRLFGPAKRQAAKTDH